MVTLADILSNAAQTISLCLVSSLSHSPKIMLAEISMSPTP